MGSQRVQTADGISVAFRLMQHPGRDTLLVLCPGFFQSKDSQPFREMAQALCDHQDVLCLDFRGHGESTGRFTFSAREHAELEAVLTWARPKYPRLIVMGFSLGAAIAIHAASRQPQHIAGVIAVSGPAVFKDIEFKFWTPEAIRCGIVGLGRGVGCRPGNLLLPKRPPIDCVPQLRGIPLLFIHGTNDVIVGVQHSRRLFAAAPDPKQLVIIPGGSHAQALFRDDPQGFLKVVNGWLQGIRQERMA